MYKDRNNNEKERTYHKRRRIEQRKQLTISTDVTNNIGRRTEEVIY